MKIKTILFSSAIAAVIALSGCKGNEGKSLSELKSEQEDAIENFTKSNGFSVVELSTNTLPANATTGVFYRFRNGLYMRIDSWGDRSKTAKLDETNVFTYIKGHQFSLSSQKSLVFDNLSNPAVPEIEFKYVYFYNAGDVHYTLMANTRPIGSYDALMCQGMAFPVSLGIGDGAELSLIIPFELGPSETYSTGITTYVEKIKYIYK